MDTWDTDNWDPATCYPNTKDPEYWYSATWDPLKRNPATQDSEIWDMDTWDPESVSVRDPETRNPESVSPARAPHGTHSDHTYEKTRLKRWDEDSCKGCDVLQVIVYSGGNSDMGISAVCSVVNALKLLKTEWNPYFDTMLRNEDALNNILQRIMSKDDVCFSKYRSKVSNRRCQKYMEWNKCKVYFVNFTSHIILHLKYGIVELFNCVKNRKLRRYKQKDTVNCAREKQGYQNTGNYNHLFSDVCRNCDVGRNSENPKVQLSSHIENSTIKPSQIKLKMSEAYLRIYEISEVYTKIKYIYKQSKLKNILDQVLSIPH
ncbi:unnamed protein product [Colias eurytheme]|nr:unnamed protein product [Colias eurytheme]